MTNLQFLRVQMELSQRDLSSKIGIDSTVLSRLERGWFAKISPDYEKRLMDFFGSQWTFAELSKSVKHRPLAGSSPKHTAAVSPTE
jgi:transcriptional regulator with XRE-family HTH domain